MLEDGTPVVERPADPAQDPRRYSSNFTEYQAWANGEPAKAEEATSETTPVAAESEAEAEAESETATTQEQEETAEKPKEEDKPKKNGIDKRFSQLTKDKRELQSRIEELTRELSGKTGSDLAQAKTAPASQDSPASETQKPKRPSLADFNTLDEYESAMDKHESVMEKWREAASSRKLEQESEKARFEKAAKAFQKSEAEARKEFDDYDEVVADTSDLQYGPAYWEALAASDTKARLRYEIAKDRDLAERISELSKSSRGADLIEAARLIGRVEGQISSKSVESAPKQQTVVSKAPPPGKPLASKSAGPPPVDHLSAMTSTSDLSVYRKHLAAYNKNRS